MVKRIIYNKIESDFCTRFLIAVCCVITALKTAVMEFGGFAQKKAGKLCIVSTGKLVCA